AGVPARFRLGTEQSEHVVGLLRIAGPDLLAVDHPVVAVEPRAGLERSEIAARAGLAVALTPLHLARERRGHEAALLLFAAELERRGHEQAGALVGAIARRAAARVLPLDDPVDQRIAVAACAAVLGGDVAVDITGFDSAFAEDPLLLIRRQRGF